MHWRVLLDLLGLWLLALLSLLILLLVLVAVEETVQLLSKLREERHDYFNRLCVWVSEEYW